MKNVFILILFFVGISFVNAASYNAEVVDKTEVLDLANLQDIVMANFECSQSATFTVSVSWLIGGSLEVTCEGTGTSETSAAQACQRANATVRACIDAWI